MLLHDLRIEISMKSQTRLNIYSYKSEMFVCVKLSCVLLRKVRQVQISVVRGRVVTSNGRASIYMS